MLHLCVQDMATSSRQSIVHAELGVSSKLERAQGPMRNRHASDHLGELGLVLQDLVGISLGVLQRQEGVPGDVNQVDPQQAVLDGDDLAVSVARRCVYRSPLTLCDMSALLVEV